MPGRSFPWATLCVVAMANLTSALPQPAPILAGAEPLVNVTSQAPINGNATILTSLLSFFG